MSYLENFFLAFVPLFVAIDVIGVLPIFMSMTSEMAEERRRKLIREASLTALAIALSFLFLGKAIFNFLGVTENDFRIGGGIVLLVLAITDLAFSSTDKNRQPQSDVGIVPIGIPLIIGPAVLTTIIISADNFGYGITLLALVLNLAIVTVSFYYSKVLLRILGKSSTNAFAKVMALFMVAIAVMMIRIGIQNSF